MHEDQSTYLEPNGIYGTDLYTTKAVDVIHKHNTSKPLFLQLSQIAVHGEENPYRLQAPEDVIERFKYIEDPVRRTFAGNLNGTYRQRRHCLDDSNGKYTFTFHSNSF